MPQNLNIQAIENIIALAKQHQVHELEVQISDLRVRVSCQQPTSSQASSPQPISQPAHIATSTQAPAAAPVTEQPSQTPSPTNGEQICSPMVGTFYRKANPEAKPFIEVGQTVAAGDVLCIVEAMKILHEVKAERAGKIANILIEDGAMVEYGQALFELI